MKTMLWVSLAFMGLASTAQAQTLEETVKYIGHRIDMAGYDVFKVNADKYGGVAIFFDGGGRAGFNLQEVKVEALNTDDNGPHVLISCNDGSDCGSLVEKSGGGTKELYLHFTIEKEAKKVAKALNHLRTLTTTKDPFAN